MRFISRFTIAVAFTLPSFNSIASDIDAEPRFENFQVASEPAFKSAKIKITDAKSREFATALREFSRKPPDFAGRYIFTEIGCGASCFMSAAIDAKSGNVVWLPFTVCCSDAEEPIEYRLNSRLIKIRGSRNETGSGTYFYEFDGHRFALIKEDEKP
jgi:hypothetical protein